MINENTHSSALLHDNKSYNLVMTDHTYSIPYFEQDKFEISSKRVNIFASGPSIQNISFNDDLLRSPVIFVNGSIQLTTQHLFTNTVGYVITDPRFIEHQPNLLTNSYTGQPLFATIAVLESIAKNLSDLAERYHQNFTVIYPVDKPKQAQSHSRSWITKLSKLKSKRIIPNLKINISRQTSANTTSSRCSEFDKDRLFFGKGINLIDYASHPNFIVDTNHSNKPIGVSLNITHGFVEAGTVAYTAAQLAYSMGAKEIHLYGIDLINNDQPRFYESIENKAPCKLDKAITNRIVPSFELLALEYGKRGVSVINHSPISKALFNNL